MLLSCATLRGNTRSTSECSLNVPVINAGDGANQHPTQTLLDLFSIAETQGKLDGINIAFVGDLKYGRTVHSLTQALAKFDNVRFFFVAHKALAMPDYLCEELEDAGIEYSCHTEMDTIIPQLDILYMTRVQKERFDESEYAHIKSAYVLNAKLLEEARSNLKVLHPLPRVDEITIDVDRTEHACTLNKLEKWGLCSPSPARTCPQ